MLRKLEAMRRSDDGKILFYILFGAIVGIAVGFMFSPKFMGCFNGNCNTLPEKRN